MKYTLAGLESQQENGWYQSCVDFNFNCDSRGKPLNSNYSITVYCGGSLGDVSCQPPPQAVFGSSPFSTNLLYPGLAPGDIPVGSDFINCAGCRIWGNAEAFIAAFAATSVLTGAGGYVPGALDAAAVSLETAGVPVTAASAWTIQNWRGIDNWRKVITWALNQF